MGARKRGDSQVSSGTQVPDTDASGRASGGRLWPPTTVFQPVTLYLSKSTSDGRATATTVPLVDMIAQSPAVAKPRVGSLRTASLHHQRAR